MTRYRKKPIEIPAPSWQCTEAAHPEHPAGVACTWTAPPETAGADHA